MSRAWPFENAEADAKIRTPQQFVDRLGKEGSEAVVIRIGMNDAQLVLVDGRGRWERWVYHSVEEASAMAESLGLPVHVGEYPEETRVRIGQFVPPAEHYEHDAYPEQGGVGPLFPYPENRERKAEPSPD